MGLVSEKKYFDADTAYDSGILHNWYIDSVSGDDEPVWTDEHIDELMNDFYVIPKETKPADVAPIVHGRWIEELGNVLSCRCSVCEHTYKLYEDDINGYPYCAWCGAKMDESEEE